MQVRPVGLAVGMVWLLATSTARAGNEDPFLYGDQAALTGGAVVSSIRDTASIWYNPAGLGQNRRGRIEISGTAFTLRLRRIPDGLALDLPTRRASDSIESRQIYVVPSALAAAREIAPGVSVGVGLFVTEEDLFNFERSLEASDATTHLDVAGALTGTVIRYHAGPAIGFQVSERLRLGATLFAVYEDQHEFRKLFVDARMKGAYETAFLQRLVDAKATRLGAELLVGAQLDAGDGWELGLSARSPRLVFRESAATDNSTALVSKGPTVPTVALSNVDHALIGAEGTGFTRPPRFVGGAAKRLGPLEISAEVEVRPKGTGITAAAPVWNVRTGLLWFAGTSTLLGLGVFTDRTGASAPATFPDYRVDYYGVSAGWKRHNSVRLQSGESASSLLFSTTIALRYAMGLGQSTRIRFDFRDTPNTGLAVRVADERVDVVYHELSLYLGTGLEF
jgi:hypothetical protein